MNNFKTLNLIAIFTALLFLTFTSCDKRDDFDPNDGGPKNPGNYSTGLQGSDNPDSIPSDFRFNFGSGNVPAAYDLTHRFPPVGDQGQYGTCVAWAAGYNMKTALNAIDNNLETAQLTSPASQTSPADLFFAIPDFEKGPNCDGTNFVPALDVMVQRGVADHQAAPYVNIGDCSQSLLNPNLTDNAGKNKIANYRKIEITVDEFKRYISEDKPVLIGMATDQNFMSWTSDDVMTSQGSANQGQHGNHALVIVGYDDAKGPRGAFRILNSWGGTWGDSGFIWVDYDLVVSPNFTFLAFVATNSTSEFDPDNIDPDASGDFNIMPLVYGDNIDQEGSSFNSRVMSYNIYNLGNSTLSSSKEWSMVYLYYNAYDINDSGVLLYDLYTDQYGAKGEDGPLEEGGIGLSGNWWTNIDLPSRQGMAEVLTNNERDYIDWYYEMPNITGYYYLVAIADPFNVVNESNEANNYQFLTNEYGGPVWIEGGTVIGLTPPSEVASAEDIKNRTTARSAEPSNMSKKLRNAYTPKEISLAINYKLKSGELRHTIAKSRKSK